MRGAMTRFGVVAAVCLVLSSQARGQHSQPFEWPASKGGNGHWYEVVPGAGCWNDKKVLSEQRGGYLATFTSAAESGFVRARIPDGYVYFLGGYQDLTAPDYVEPAGGWRFVTGEAWVPLWDPAYNQPDGGAKQNKLSTYSFGLHDVQDCVGLGGSIIEWSADCNNDGIVDYGQILSGDLADANANGVPDLCETGPCPTSFLAFGAGEAGEASDIFDLGQSTIPAVNSPIMQASGGIYHSAGVLADGTVVCWGSNATPFNWPNGVGRVFGTDLNGTPISSGTIGQRVQLLGSVLTGVAEVGAGELHTIARRFDGSVVGWGNNDWGQLNVPAGLVAVKISTGSLHNLALTPSGGVVCWGAWCGGMPKGASSGMIDIDAGYEHSLAWNAAGMLYAWGRNDFGESTVPSSLPLIKQAGGGGRSTIALGMDGVVRAWGSNVHGQCAGTRADGSTDESGGTQLRVVRILGQPLDNVVAISAGGYHGLALRTDGSVVAWGLNIQGQTVVPAAAQGRTVLLEGGYVHSIVEVTSATEDCNANGMIDCVELALGVTADADGNSVPDICEATTFRVPVDFPTIQAAIDATPSGAARTIVVAAGTYNEGFSLNGKNVVVRGAPNNATILDGTGLTTSIVRFSGGEPVTAGIENLVLRNGTAGSLIFPKASFRVGGGLYAANSSAYIRNCRFESNRSNFGGGAYLYRSSTSVEGCQFVANTATNEGGALQLFESSGPIANSAFTVNSAGPAGVGAASALKVVGARTAGGTVLVSNCTIQAGVGGNDASAVEMFESAGSGGLTGVLRIVSTVISGNSAMTGAGGLRVVGSQSSCVLTGGTSICSNLPRNVSGPFLIEGSATVCDCLSDLTLDRVVNGADLGVVLAAWGAASSNGAGDANRDGFVNGADLAQILAAWGACQ